MSKVDITQWKKFCIGDLFVVDKGKRLRNVDMKPGETQFIGSSAYNNGITSYISNEEHVQPANTITVAYNGSVGATFYHSEEYWACDDVNVLKPKFKLTENIALYLAPIFRRRGEKYEFKDKWNKKAMEGDYIYLPATPDGEPDWDYMEAYIKGVREDAQKTIDLFNRIVIAPPNKRIDITTWGKYRVGDLFKIKPTKNLGMTNKDLFASSGNTPVVVNSSYNNGIGGYVPFSPTEKAGTITFSDTTDASSIFYQPNDFIGYSHVQGMYSKVGDIPELAKLFFVVAFKARALTKGFDYVNKFRRDIATELIVNLPAAPNGEPDWTYMESYIQSALVNNKDTIELLNAIA